MCRNIRPLFNFDPATTDEEIRASAIQYVRKVSGYSKPSCANEVAFEHAIERVTEVTRELLAALVTSAPVRDRAVEAAKARERARQRFA